eukprot:Selendium_serpulae@DN10143_c0_g1_i1.p1
MAAKGRTCFEHIAAIRSRLHLQDTTQQQRYHRIIGLLSEELYSSAGRCLLELLQNCDDAPHPSSRPPAVLFRLTGFGPDERERGGDAVRVRQGHAARGALKNGPDQFLLDEWTCPALVVVSNQTGLTPADVEALCDAGASTKTSRGLPAPGEERVKGASRQQRIGEKGIGFKSVFKVT